MADVITNPKMKAFVESTVNKDFGLSVETVAEKCKNYGRFKHWLNSDVNQIKNVLQTVKDNGVSPAFFASYEKTEGFNSKWGWLNHTRPQGTPTQDAISVSNWIKTQSKNTSDRPAWIDVGNPVDFVPASVKTAGNNHFASMTSGTIGKVIIAGTAAATWAVYYPNGLKKEYNKIQDYADPIKGMYESIEAWGGTLDGSTNPPVDPPPVDGNWGGLDLSQLIEDVTKKMIVMLSTDVFKSGNSTIYTNNYIQLQKQLDTLYKVQPNKNFLSEIEKIFKEFNAGYIPPPTDPDPDPPTPSGQWYFPVKLGSGINFWKRSNWGVGTLQREMTYGTRANGKFHAGYDIGGGGRSHAIYAVADAVVTDIRWVTGGGYSIFLNHTNDEYHTLYLHLVDGSATVSKGDTVSAGQKIATMGATGGNYAIHLHIEFSKTGAFHTSANTVDPEPLLKVTADNKTGLSQP